VTRRLLLLLGLAWLAALGGARAQAQVVLGQDGSYALAPAVSYLRDSAGTMTLADVLQPARQAALQPVANSATATNFGLTPDAIWMRVAVRLAPGAPRDWLLQVAYPPLDSVDLYVPDGAGGWARSRAGDSVLPRDSMPHRTHVLRVALPPGSEHLLYVRVASQGPVSAPLRLWQPEACGPGDQKTYSVLSLYFGLLLGLLAYNLLLYLSVRDRAFLLYVAFVACLGWRKAR
jgi:hypothetical protein